MPEVIWILIDKKPVKTYIDSFGTQRFFANEVVRHLIDSESISLNDLRMDLHHKKFSLQAYKDFYISMGYSVGGFDEIFGASSGVSEETGHVTEIFNPLWQNYGPVT